MTEPLAVPETWKSELLYSASQVYGLGQCTLAEEFGLWGTTCRWRIRIAAGRDYFLKEKPSYLGDAEFELHLRLHEYLQSYGGPVGELQLTSSGDPFSIWEKRIFEMQEYIHGRHLSPTSSMDLRALGRALGQFHALSASFEPQQTVDWELTRIRATAFPETWQDVYSYTRHLDFAYHLLGYHNFFPLTWIREWISEYGQKINHKLLPQAWLHGDVNCFNSLMLNGNQLKLVDLDNAHWGYRIADTAAAAASVGAIFQPTESSYARIYDSLQSEHVERFLTALKDVYPFTEAEQEYWSTFLGLNIIRIFISWFAIDDGAILTEHLDKDVECIIEMLRELSR